MQPIRTIYLVGLANAGKSWLRTVVFDRKLPLELVLERRETKLNVTNVRNTDFLYLDIWGKRADFSNLRKTKLNLDSSKKFTL